MGSDKLRCIDRGNPVISRMGIFERQVFARQTAFPGICIWGITTWFSSIVKTYPQFLVTRSSTGIDDSSYPGMYSLVADYFNPRVRGKVYGLMQFSQPIGYLVGMILALMVAPMIGGWRSVFYITGSLGPCHRPGDLLRGKGNAARQGRARV